jgi:TPR repeat protein
LDREKIMARFEMAAMGSMAERQPNGESLFDLGMIYSTGRDVGTDLVAAHKWFNLAALRGNAEAIYYRQQVADEMSPAAIAEAQRAARDWLGAH